MSDQELSKVVVAAVKSALAEFKVDPELHYNHHTRLTGMFQSFDIVWKIFIGIGVTATVAVLAGAVAAVAKGHL